MLRKMLKYDLKAMAKTFIPFYAVILLMSVLNIIFIRAEWTPGMVSGTLIYVCLFMALAVVALVLGGRSPAAQRSMLKRQLEGEQTQRLATPGWVVLGQNGFTATSGALCSYRPYSCVNAVVQDENYIFLRFEGNMITAVPKRGFESPEQARQAFEFLRQKLSEQKSGR